MFGIKTLRYIFQFTALLLLTACSTLDMRGAYTLSKKGPMDGDPATGRIAILWPEGIDSAGLLTTFSVKTDGKEPRVEQFMLDLAENETAAIKRPKAFKDADIMVHRVREEDVERARKFQIFLETLEHNRIKHRFGVHIFPLTGPTSPKALNYCNEETEAPFYVWFKLDNNSSYQRIIRTKNIQKAIRNIQGKFCKSARQKYEQ